MSFLARFLPILIVYWWWKYNFHSTKKLQQNKILIFSEHNHEQLETHTGIKSLAGGQMPSITASIPHNSWIYVQLNYSLFRLIEIPQEKVFLQIIYSLSLSTIFSSQIDTASFLITFPDSRTLACQFPAFAIWPSSSSLPFQNPTCLFLFGFVAFQLALRNWFSL